MVWRTNHNVPEVYPAMSRDFQLLGRLLDVVMNSIKFDIDAMNTSTSAETIMSSLLPLLQNKVGFFSNYEFSDIELRYVLGTFPTIIKNKGSKQGILDAVNVFLRLYCLDNYTSSAYAEIGTTKSTSELDNYTIHIYIESTPKDTKVLDEIFRYILPTGYTVEYTFYNKLKTNTDELYSYNENIYVNKINNLDNNIRPIDVENKLSNKQKIMVGTAGLTEVNNDIINALEAKANGQKNKTKKKKITSK